MIILLSKKQAHGVEWNKWAGHAVMLRISLASSTHWCTSGVVVAGFLSLLLQFWHDAVVVLVQHPS
jgi:hypothetical protein